jgi:hypothetical protein
MVLYVYMLCLCILASSRMPRYYLGRQTPAFLGGFCHSFHLLRSKKNDGQSCNQDQLQIEVYMDPKRKSFQDVIQHSSFPKSSWDSTSDPPKITHDRVSVQPKLMAG